MIRYRRTPELSGDWPVLGHLLAISAVCGLLALALGRLLAPTVLTNPSVAAYTPPPGTLLIPRARTLDAPELAAALEPSPYSSLARAPDVTPPAPTQPPEPRPVRKRTRPAAPEVAEQNRGYDRGWGFDRNWNDGYRQRSGAWNDNSRDRYSNNRQGNGGLRFW